MLADLSPAIVEAHALIHRKEDIGRAMEVLGKAIVANPMADGLADALYLQGHIFTARREWHRLEMTCLLAWRFRASAIDPQHVFNALVNLTRACLLQRSPHEALAYGEVAEQLNDQDLDLASNLYAAQAMTQDGAEQGRHFRMLQAQDPSRIAHIRGMLEGEGDYAPTDQLDATDLVRRFEALAHQPPNPQEFFSIIDELGRRPDARGAERCWRMLCRFYLDTMPASPRTAQEHFVAVQNSAGLAAAAGKAISARPDLARKDPVIWAWYGTGLGQLCLYELAERALERSLSIAHDADVQRNLRATRAAIALGPESSERVDSVARRRELVGHLPNDPARSGSARSPSVADSLPASLPEGLRDVVREWKSILLMAGAIGAGLMGWHRYQVVVADDPGVGDLGAVAASDARLFVAWTEDMPLRFLTMTTSVDDEEPVRLIPGSWRSFDLPAGRHVLTVGERPAQWTSTIHLQAGELRRVTIQGRDPASTGLLVESTAVMDPATDPVLTTTRQAQSRD